MGILIFSKFVRKTADLLLSYLSKSIKNTAHALPYSYFTIIPTFVNNLSLIINK